MNPFRAISDRLLEVPIVYRTWQAPFAQAKLRPFMQRVDVGRLESVLDVGCGPGTNASVFQASRYVGVDINPEYIATASARFGPRFVVGDVADPAVLPAQKFQCVFANSLMHHLNDAVTRRLLKAMADRVVDDGEVHVLDLVLPDAPTPARLMARLDRGRFARPLERWRELFSEAMVVRHFQPYPLGIPGVPLWQMVYFVGVPR